MRKLLLASVLVAGFTTTGALAADAPKPVVSPEIMTRALEDYGKCINEKNAPACVDLFAEDGSIEDPVGSEPRKGKAALTEFYKRLAQTEVTLEVVTINTAPGGAVVMFNVRGYLGTGKFTLPNTIDTATFNAAGKITKMLAYPKLVPTGK
jgi:steroid delta-isomerase